MTPVRAVAVATATLWTGPQAARAIDAPALDAPSRIREWTDALGQPERLDLHGRVESQALLGDRVIVDGEQDGWARVRLPGQPSSKDPRGYPGWIPLSQLTDWERPAGLTVVVTVPTTTLHDAPSGAIVVDDLSFATELPQAGPAVGSWLPVHVPGRLEPCWLPAADTDIDPASPTPQDLITAARQFIGLPYLWGGTCGLGLDCSGLIHTVFRRYATDVPRDAHDQAAAGGVQVSPDDASPGDLLFFAEHGRDVHHVGIATSEGRMLHAPETGRGVVEDLPSPRRLEQLVGALRWW